jgi:hypothetical protein
MTPCSLVKIYQIYQIYQTTPEGGSEATGTKASRRDKQPDE